MKLPHVLAYRIVGLSLTLGMIVGGLIIGNFGESVGASQAKTSSLTSIGGCPLFPANNIWNYNISKLPVHPHSAQFIASIGLGGHLHPDFGSGLYQGEPIGIPYAVVPGNQRLVPVHFDYADESDPGPYPIPANVPIEGGSRSSGDRHVIVVDSGNCKLYEMFASYPQGDGSWKAGSGAVWDLNSNALRPKGWTSADAAGLPILPGLVRYDEVAAGAINHALRFTVSRTQAAFLWPARHLASSQTDPNLPPMGLRLRLKASVDIASFSPANRVILTALKRYGMIVADNGSSWFISGAPDSHWNNDDLHLLDQISGSDFEVVDESSLQVSADSGQARGVSVPTQPTSTPTVALAPVTIVTVGATSTEMADVKGNKNVLKGEDVRGGGVSLWLMVELGVLGIVLVVMTVMVRRRWRFKVK